MYLKVPPKISPFGVQNPLDSGELMQLSCIVSAGDQPMQIKWSFEGQASKTTQNDVTIVKNSARSSSLIIGKLQVNIEHLQTYRSQVKVDLNSNFIAYFL